MKQYTIYEVKKARGDQGNCLVCGEKIKTGDAFRRLSAPNPDKVFFCANCPVDQSLIGKNTKSTQNGKVREKLEIKTKGQTKQIASLITEEKPDAPEELLSKEEKTIIAKQEEDEEESNDILAKSGLGVPKFYCSKCKRSHEAGSRRYERHIQFIKK